MTFARWPAAAGLLGSARSTSPLTRPRGVDRPGRHRHRDQPAGQAQTHRRRIRLPADVAGPDAAGLGGPAELTALEKAGAPAQEELAYTFRHAATPAQISADLSELGAALRKGAIVTYASWLNTELFWESAAGSVSPFLIAFAVIALALAMLIAASYRRIGVLKSIGFTPPRSRRPTSPSSASLRWPGPSPGP
jgi:hypothetical protein